MLQFVFFLYLSLSLSLSLFPQGVVGTECSLKTAVVSLFIEGVLEIEGDEKGMCDGVVT